MATSNDHWQSPALPAYPSQSTWDGHASGSGDDPQTSGGTGFATAALGFGIVGGILLAVPFGILGLRRSKISGKGRRRSIAGLILSVVWATLLAAGAFGAISGGTSSLDVKAGDCLRDLPTGARVMSVSVVPCDQPHVAEAYALLEMPKGSFPGNAAMETFSEKCDPALQTYAPGAHADTAVGIYMLYPTRWSWNLGDRVITCIAITEAPQTGTIKGAPLKESTPKESTPARGINV